LQVSLVSPGGAGPRAWSVAAATTRKAWASIARVAQRYQERQRRTWRSAVRAAELDDLHIHDLRHTAVALWIAAGASPKEVARRAGHTSVKTVLDVYGHLYAEADVALRERLEAMFVPVAALPVDLCGPTGQGSLRSP
jgi:integrase